MRIAIVNDSAQTVEALRRVLAGVHEIAWVAADGEAAVTRCQSDRPDLLLMDLLMPRLNGVEATRRIMAASPCPIVIVTAAEEQRPGLVFEAMGAGAVDAVQTPDLTGDGAIQLLAKVDTVRRLVMPVECRSQKSGNTTRILARSEPVVCIGASAGGPTALAQMLGALPADFPAALVVVQHLDPQFAGGLATWLGSQTPLRVRLAEEGERLRPGTVFLPGHDLHLVFANEQRLGYTRIARDQAFRPSVDVLLHSAAEHCRGPVVGVLLTGMGRDGAAGLLLLRRRGFLTIAQDEASSAVFGMPKAAIELQAATEILALDKIAPRLMNVFA